jgi:penicillin-binding protein activator
LINTEAEKTNLMKRNQFIALVILGLILTINVGCNKTVNRVDPTQRIDLSGRWNDTDSRLVAEEMVTDALGRFWRPNFVSMNNRNPVIIVGGITNKSHEHIEPSTFIKDIEREFINSGAIRVVANSEFREKLRQERADQHDYASPQTIKKWGAEIGADYMMFGTINSIVDTERNKKVIFYQINLELTHLMTNEVVWIGDKKIKKFVVR